MTAAVHVLPTAAARAAAPDVTPDSGVSPPAPTPLLPPADIFAELRGLLASARGALDDLGVEVDSLTSLNRMSRDGSSRALVRQMADAVHVLVLAAEHRALAEANVTLPATMSVNAFERQAWWLKKIAGELAAFLRRLDGLVEVATARRFKPRARRLEACGVLVQLGTELRRLDRDLSAAPGVRS